MNVKKKRGRQPLTPGSSTVVFSVRLDRNILPCMMAEAAGMPLSEWVRKLIAESLARARETKE